MATMLTRPRAIRALTEDFGIEQIAPGVYRVHSHSGNTYHVNVTEQWCSCPDHEHREVSCKHLLRVMFKEYSSLDDEVLAGDEADTDRATAD